MKTSVRDRQEQDERRVTTLIRAADVPELDRGGVVMSPLATPSAAGPGLGKPLTVGATPLPSACPLTAVGSAGGPVSVGGSPLSSGRSFT